MKVFMLLLVTLAYVQGHGYMSNPPSRSSAWKFGFNTPSNTNHMGLNCGGAQTQHGKNGGKCGVCGDDYGKPNKPNEPGPGNKYATGTIVANYWSGDVIDITIHLTAFHKGYFEFRLCDNNVPQKGTDKSIAVKQSCFDKHLLTNADGNSTRFEAGEKDPTHKVKLPAGVECTACVLQWRYRAGNGWGCEDSQCATGLGPQEEFWGCADVAINRDDTTPTQSSTVPTTQDSTTPKPTTTSPKPTTATPKPTTTPPKQTTTAPELKTTIPKSTTTTPLPTATTPEPTKTTPKPTTTPKPNTITPKPTKATPKPTTATPKPTTTTPKPTTTTPKPRRTTPKPRRTTRKPVKPVKPGKRRRICRGVGVWKHLTGWCNLMCNYRQPVCPRSHCACR